MSGFRDTLYSIRYSLVMLTIFVAMYLVAFWLLASFAVMLLIPMCIAWLVVSIIVNIIWRPKASTFALRLLMPVITVGTILLIGNLQIRLIQSNMESIGHACISYHQDTGRYPEKLDVLVPKYLDSIPTLLLGANFEYYTLDGEATLMFAIQPPFGRLFYNLPAKTWTSLDLF